MIRFVAGLFFGAAIGYVCGAVLDVMFEESQ